MIGYMMFILEKQNTFLAQAALCSRSRTLEVNHSFTVSESHSI